MLYKFISESQNNLKVIFKIFLIVTFCLSVTFVLLCAAAAILSQTDFLYETLSAVTAVILGISAFLNSFVLSKLFKENGWFWGVFSATVLIVFIVISSVYYNTFNFSNIFFTKMVVVLASGTIGGIIGVNIN